MVNVIRNKAGFHSDAETIKRGYDFFPHTELFVDYLSEHRGHCLYFSSEIMAVVGMARLIDKNDWKAGITKVVGEIIEMSGKMADFFLEYMRAFVEMYIAANVTDVHKDKFTIADGPPIDTVTIPFFCAPPKNWP